MYEYTNGKRSKSIMRRRKQIFKDPQPISNQKYEHILTKWLRTYLKSSSVHGLSHLVQHGRHFLENKIKDIFPSFNCDHYFPIRSRFLWILALLAMAYPSYLLVMFAWDHYNLNPSVVSIERHSKSWPSKIPTMTLCQTTVQMPIDIDEEDDEQPEDATINNETIEEAASGSFPEERIQNVNETSFLKNTFRTLRVRKRHIWEFKDIDEEDNTTLNDAREKESGYRRAYIPHKLIRHFKDILGAHYNNSEMERFLNLIILGNFSSYSELGQYKGTVYDTQFSPDLYIKWAAAIAEPQGDRTPDGHRNESVLTEFGPCQMYNSDIGRYSTKEYWDKQNNLNTTSNIQDENETILLPELSTVILHKERLNSFKVFFHSPNDLIDLDSRHLSYHIDTFIQLEVRIENIWTTAEVGKLSIQQRHCRHSNETELRHSPEVYSYKLCKIECRIELCLKYCNCTPYYYRKLDGERTCGVNGLICLSKHASKMQIIKSDCDIRCSYVVQITTLEKNGQSACKCIQNCDFVNARVIQVAEEQWILKSSIETTFYNMQRIRYKRTLIYTQMDLLVQAGGIAGLCYGMGFLSVVEFVYHITIRIFFVLSRKLRDKK